MPRPRSVTLLACAVFCLAAYLLAGAASGLQRYAFLASLPLPIPPVYLILRGAVWGLVFGALAVGLWRQKEWGRVGMLTASALYVAHAWFDRLLLSRSEFARQTIPFALLLSLLGLSVIWTILLRRAVRRTFSV